MTELQQHSVTVDKHAGALISLSQSAQSTSVHQLSVRVKCSVEHLWEWRGGWPSDSSLLANDMKFPADVNERVNCAVHVVQWMWRWELYTDTSFVWHTAPAQHYYYTPILLHTACLLTTTTPTKITKFLDNSDS